MNLIIDGVEWPLVASFHRRATMEDTDLSGTMMDRSKFHDVEGTYLEYDVEVAIPFWFVGRYATFYEVLTAPVGEHMVVVPYNDTEVTIPAKIDVVEDDYVRRPNGRNYWRNTKFTVSATAPTKELTLGEVIARGHAAMPDLDGGTEGDTWTYTDFQWVFGHYNSADDVYY